MRVVKPQSDLLFYQSPIVERPNPLVVIETIGRTCYKSEELITDDSAPRFCEGLIARKHFAMLEHVPICFKVSDYKAWESLFKLHTSHTLYKEPLFRYHLDFIHFELNGENQYLISGNVRAFNESPIMPIVGHCIKAFSSPLAYNYPSTEPSNLVKELYNEVSLLSKEDFSTYPQEIKDKLTFLTFKFLTDRGVSHELVRHRNCAFAQESTRYCNYMKDKFGHEIRVIKPRKINPDLKEYELWEHSCVVAEKMYFSLLDLGATPQTARSVLPTSLATTIAVTASVQEWRHIFDLRLVGVTGAPHPDMKRLMDLAVVDFPKKHKPLIF